MLVFSIDTIIQVSFACFFSDNFSDWKTNILLEITQDEAYDIFKKCVKEIQKRLIINLSNFKVTVVDKNGIRSLPDITAANLIDYVP